MSQKKTNYWDMIFMNQVPETEETSPEEKTLDFSAPALNQEQERHVREILFSEEGYAQTPAELVSFADAVNSSELEHNAVPIVEEASEDVASSVEDDFFGWNVTSKKYAHVGFDCVDVESKEAAPDVTEPVEVASGATSDDVSEEERVEAVEVVEAVEMPTGASATESSLEIDAKDSTEIVSEKPEEPILTEDGTLRVTLNRYERPVLGFGFGLLEEETSDVEDALQTDSEEENVPVVAYTSVENDTEEECVADVTETCQVVPDGLDSWGSLAFELGLPVTLPETSELVTEKVSNVSKKSTKKTDKANKLAKSEKVEIIEDDASFDKVEVKRDRSSGRKNRAESSENIVSITDDEFVSPENVRELPSNYEKKMARPEQTERPERLEHRSQRGRRNRWEEQEETPVEMASVPVLPSELDDGNSVVEVAPRSRRRRRGNVPNVDATANEEKSATISEIMAGVVASKMTDEMGKQPRRPRAERIESEMTGDDMQGHRERSRRNRRGTIDENLQSANDESQSLRPYMMSEVDEDEQEMNVPNGARSRRRRRSQREKMEQTQTSSYREARGGIKDRPVHAVDDNNGLDSWSMCDTDDISDIDDVEENAYEREPSSSRLRRQRRSRRSLSRDGFRETNRGYDDEAGNRYGHPQDDEEHVFTEVGNDEEDVDDEWETDFSQHEVPSWRYTIDFIVNTNLKARKREPSSLAGNINRMSGKRPRRK